jgi:hypothetical protein
MEETFSMRSVPRCYNQDQLAASVTAGVQPLWTAGRCHQVMNSEEVTVDTSVCVKWTVTCSHTLYQSVQ